MVHMVAEINRVADALRLAFANTLSSFFTFARDQKGGGPCR
jgi:hypothetical protein